MRKDENSQWVMGNGEWILRNRRFFLLMVIAVACALLTMIASCNSSYTPKPKGYYRIDFPEKKYRLFNQEGYPYSFEYPEYANVVKDSTFFGEATENPWWINIDFPQFHGRIYVSYKEIGKNNFDTLVKHSFELTGKHTSRAYSIEDTALATPNGVHGVFFTVGGDVATANQFFLSDTTKHFLRGALYFDATPNADSLGIVNSFLLTDMRHLINTFKWRK